MTTSVENWQHRDIITNGIRMHYVTQGSGPLVVLLHGFPEYWYSWRLQIPVLADLGYTVVAPDLRGYNDTDKPRTGYSVSNLLRDIVGLIAGLGYEQAVIIGHDWGGALAWAFAARYPTMTKRLVVMNAPHPAAMLRDLRTLRQLRKSWYIFAFQIPWLPETILARDHAAPIGKLIVDAAVQKSAFTDEDLVHYRDAMSKPGALKAAINYYRALVRALPRQRGGGRTGTTIGAPTLLIWGEQDVALDISLTRGLEALVDDLTVRYIPDSGHWVQQEKPAQVNQWLSEFLGDK